MNQSYLLLLLACLSAVCWGCVHDTFAKNVNIVVHNDVDDIRLLQSNTIGPLRIFADFSAVSTGSQAEITLVQRMINLTALYFYNVINISRLDHLYYPSPGTCAGIVVPDKYILEGTIGDLGLLVANENNPTASYVAKSSACATLNSTKRPFWGGITVNNAYIKFDQQGVQEMLFIAMHEITHILGMSAFLFPTYPTGNPLLKHSDADGDTDYFLNTPKIMKQLQQQFNCSSVLGMPLEDQDSVPLSSHWQKQIIGAEYMIASTVSGVFVSNITLALLDSTGWYDSVNYTFAERSPWGKNKSCSFFNLEDCVYPQFCTFTSYDCDFTGITMGSCGYDVYTGVCKIVKYYTNTMCIDENFTKKNLNSFLMTQEVGGYNSRCFASNFRSPTSKPTILNNRCYTTLCSAKQNYLFIIISPYILVCSTPGQILNAPKGLFGTLKCPTNFSTICNAKKMCVYHCNKNGICIDGMCLCSGSLTLTATCLDNTFNSSAPGTTGGFISLTNSNSLESSARTVYGLNQKCLSGTFLNEFGDCQLCENKFNCFDCTALGCNNCNNGSAPVNKKC